MPVPLLTDWALSWSLCQPQQKVFEQPGIVITPRPIPLSCQAYPVFSACLSAKMDPSPVLSFSFVPFNMIYAYLYMNLIISSAVYCVFPSSSYTAGSHCVHIHTQQTNVRVHFFFFETRSCSVAQAWPGTHCRRGWPLRLPGHAPSQSPESWDYGHELL